MRRNTNLLNEHRGKISFFSGFLIASLIFLLVYTQEIENLEEDNEGLKELYWEKQDIIDAQQNYLQGLAVRELEQERECKN